ncbi:MAG: hypothetical protein FJ170_01425 [Gammaproteobacteria bacterium]|nr:hypothetical protein [Gammaproteobacteria bacterium]
MLGIDESWMERRSRGFAWIGHRLRQEVEASPTFDSLDTEVSGVTFSTTIATGVTADTEKVHAVLAELNSHAICCAYVYDVQVRTIRAVCIGYVHSDVLAWRARSLAVFAMIQLCLAESEADWIADITGGRVSVGSHPISGVRDMPDEMLSVLDGLIAIEGGGLSKFADASEFEAMADTVRQMNAATLGGSVSGICFEFPYGSETSLVRFQTQVRHRRAGAGLQMSLSLPMQASPTDLAAMAASLNQREAAAECMAGLYGAWCVSPPVAGGGDTLSYRAFLPNILYRPGRAQQEFYSLARRAHWVNQLLNPGVPEIDTWEFVRERLKVLGLSAHGENALEPGSDALESY